MRSLMNFTTLKSWEMNMYVRLNSACNSFKDSALVPALRHQRRDRFVANDELGIKSEGTGNTNTLALTTREFVG